MKKLIKNIFYLFVFLTALNACQSVKEGLSGQKKTTSIIKNSNGNLKKSILEKIKSN